MDGRGKMRNCVKWARFEGQEEDLGAGRRNEEENYGLFNKV